MINMKTRNFMRLMILLLSIVLISCNKDDNDKWYNSMPDGGEFKTGTILRFFYIDENGNDLINPKDLTTLPVSSIQLLPSQPEIKGLYKNYSYNNDLNNIIFNKNKNLHEFFTYAFGDSRNSSYTFYVYYKGVADKMNVTFIYQNHKVDGGTCYASDITSWKVNNTLVYTNNDTGLVKYVYLVKKADGTTSIKFAEN